MKNALLAMISGLSIMATALGPASARTQPANLGTAHRGTQVDKFDHDANSGAVNAIGEGAWAEGLVLDTFGQKQINVTARATNQGAFVRCVSDDGYGTLLAATPFVAIPVNPNYVGLTFSLFVPNNGVLSLDAIMVPGASIHRTLFIP